MLGRNSCALFPSTFFSRYDLYGMHGCPTLAEHPLVGAGSTMFNLHLSAGVSHCMNSRMQDTHFWPQQQCNPKVRQDFIVNIYSYSEHVLMGAIFCLVAPYSFQRNTAMTRGYILSSRLKPKLKIALRWSICVLEELVISSPSEKTVDFSELQAGT